jgi:hypothetical protein
LPLPVQSFPTNAIAQASSTPTTAEEFFNRGVEKLDQGDLPSAIADFNLTEGLLMVS